MLRIGWFRWARFKLYSHAVIEGARRNSFGFAVPGALVQVECFSPVDVTRTCNPASSVS